MAGIYIHIPFCHQACTYCNFHFSTSLDKKERFIESLIKEIGLNDFIGQPALPVETIYFGGGTPSILETREISLLLKEIRDRYDVSGTAEVTLEANPDDINPARLDAWLKAGINRLSVGVQSFHEDELRWMNRSHSAKDSLQCIHEIKAAGFVNFSVDLIYGSPLQTDAMLDANLDHLFNLAVPHLSCYALTAEPKTILQNKIDRKETAPPDPDRQSAQFLQLMKRMADAGYNHYEISNYALPGKESRHNSSYWKGDAYLGLGPSAHSFDGQRTRRWNLSNNSLYIESLLKGVIPYEEEVLLDEQLMNEYIMTSLRTKEGISLAFIRMRFGAAHVNRLIVSSEKFNAAGRMRIHQDHLQLTDEGKLFADGIAADLFV